MKIIKETNYVYQKFIPKLYFPRIGFNSLIMLGTLFSSCITKKCYE